MVAELEMSLVNAIKQDVHSCPAEDIIQILLTPSKCFHPVESLDDSLFAIVEALPI